MGDSLPQAAALGNLFRGRFCVVPVAEPVTYDPATFAHIAESLDLDRHLAVAAPTWTRRAGTNAYPQVRPTVLVSPNEYRQAGPYFAGQESGCTPKSRGMSPLAHVTQ